jgi:hypothetical protein
MSDPAWKKRTRPEEGVMVLDLTRDLDTDPRNAPSEDRRSPTPARLPNFAAPKGCFQRNKILCCCLTLGTCEGDRNGGRLSGFSPG